MNNIFHPIKPYGKIIIIHASQFGGLFINYSYSSMIY